MNNDLELVNEISVALRGYLTAGGLYSATRLVGSQYINGSGEDVDILVLCPNIRKADEVLIGLGYERDGGEAYRDQFDHWGAYRKGRINMLVTEGERWFKDFGKAADVCLYVSEMLKRRGGCYTGLSKEQRIEIHRIVRDGADPAVL